MHQISESFSFDHQKTNSVLNVIRYTLKFNAAMRSILPFHATQKKRFNGQRRPRFFSRIQFHDQIESKSFVRLLYTDFRSYVTRSAEANITIRFALRIPLS